ncbi:MAG: hypothetical protein ACRDTG_12875 [Pseudonocardiaceae bacterium]
MAEDFDLDLAIDAIAPGSKISGAWVAVPTHRSVAIRRLSTELGQHGSDDHCDMGGRPLRHGREHR